MDVDQVVVGNRASENCPKKSSLPFTSNGTHKGSSLVKPGATKKIVIRNFEKPKLPEDYLEQTWDKLKEAVVAVQTSRPVSTPLEELYQAVENLCSHKMAPKLYNNLEALCVDHVKTNMVNFKDNMDNITFLKTLDLCWQDHCKQMVSTLIQCIPCVLMYFYLDSDPKYLFVFGSNFRPTKCIHLFDMGYGT